MEISIKNNLDSAQPIANVKIVIDKLLKKILVLDTIATTSESRKEPLNLDQKPRIESRHGIRSGLCPIGLVMRGGFCFHDDDY